MSISVAFPDSKGYIDFFVTKDDDISKFMDDLNKHFEKNRRSTTAMCPLYFEWTIVILFETPVPEINNHIANMEERMYAEVATRNNYNAMPPSVRAGAPESNNWLLPPKFENYQFLRMKMNLAPNFIARFKGSFDNLGALGFDVADFTLATKGNSRYYELSNAGNTLYKSVRARTKPNAKLTTVPWRIDLLPHDFNSPDVPLLVTQSMLDNPLELRQEIDRGLISLASQTNFRMKISFDTTSGTFAFDFPSSGKAIVSVNLSKEVSEALGFDTQTIYKTSKARPMRSDDDSTDSLAKSVVLAYDTGQIMLVQDEANACSVRGANENLLALLKPTMAGKMEMSALPFCTPLVSLAGQETSDKPGHNKVTFSFLHVEDHSGKVQKMSWPCNAYVEGLLVGLPCSCTEDEYK